MSTEFKREKYSANKSQEIIVPKLRAYLKIVLNQLEPGSKPYKAFLRFQKDVEHYGIWFCYGFAVKNAIGQLPDNARQGAPNSWNAKLYHIANWRENEADLDNPIFIGDFAPATTLRAILIEAINAIFPAQLSNFLTSIDSPFIGLTQDTPEKHISIALPKAPLSEPLLSPENIILKIANQDTIAGYFTPENLILSLDDDDTKRILSKNPCIIEDGYHTGSIRYDEYMQGWFLYDCNLDEDEVCEIGCSYENEKFCLDISDLANQIFDSFDTSFSLNVWYLIQENQSELKGTPQKKPFEHFRKILAEKPGELMMEGGIVRMLANRRFYREHRDDILKVLRQSKNFSLSPQIAYGALGITVLTQASYNNDTELMQLFLSSMNQDEKIIASNHFSPLLGAVINGNKEFVEFFLKKGDSINKSNRNGNTPLIFAVIYNHEEIVKFLFEKKADIDKANHRGWTALTYAAAHNRLNIVEILISHQADLDRKDEFHQTPLMLACIYGHIDIVRALIKADADFTLTDDYGCTVMDLAAENGFFEIWEILATKMRQFAEKNGDEKLSNSDKIIPAKNQLIFMQAAERGDNKTFKEYLEKMDVQAPNKRGLTAAELAARNGHFEICASLFEKIQSLQLKDNTTAPDSTPLDKKVNVDKAQDTDALLKFVDAQLPGEQPLLIKMAEQLTTSALIWLQNNSKIDLDPHVIDEKGRNALMVAILKADAEIVRHLVGLDKTPEKKSLQAIAKDRATPLHLAIRSGRMDIVNYLIQSGAKPGESELQETIKRRDYEMVDQLSRVGMVSQFAFESALKARHFPIAQLLFNRMLNFNQAPKLKDAKLIPKKESSLSLDEKANFSEIQNTDELLSLINAQLSGNQPLLIKMAEQCTTDTLKWLQKNSKINPHVTDAKGRNALMAAIFKGDAEMVRFLIELDNISKKSLRTPANNGETPLLLAVRSGRSVIVNYLLNSGAEPEHLELLEAIESGKQTIAKQLATASKVRASANLIKSALAKGYFDTGQLLLNTTLNSDHDLKIKDFSSLSRETPSLILWTITNLPSDQSPAIVKLILEGNVDHVNRADENGETPLQKAIAQSTYGNPELIEILVAAGATIQLKNNQQQDTAGLDDNKTKLQSPRQFDSLDSLIEFLKSAVIAGNECAKTYLCSILDCITQSFLSAFNSSQINKKNLNLAINTLSFMVGKEVITADHTSSHLNKITDALLLIIGQAVLNELADLQRQFHTIVSIITSAAVPLVDLGFILEGLKSKNKLAEECLNTIINAVISTAKVDYESGQEYLKSIIAFCRPAAEKGDMSAQQYLRAISEKFADTENQFAQTHINHVIEHLNSSKDKKQASNNIPSLAGNSFCRWDSKLTLDTTRNNDTTQEEAKKAERHKEAFQNFSVKCDPLSQWTTGHHYEFGTGVKKDLKAAFACYYSAAKKQHPRAIYEVGRCYENGIGVGKNPEEAFKCYQLAVSLGNLTAKYHLGRCYENGVGVEKNLQEAFKNYQLAASSGSPTAIYHVARCYEYGIGVDMDFKKAKEWYREADSDLEDEDDEEEKQANRNDPTPARISNSSLLLPYSMGDNPFATFSNSISSSSTSHSSPSSVSDELNNSGYSPPSNNNSGN